MIAKITCPSCKTMGQFSVDGGNFKGPYKCWKCRALYTLDMVNSEVVSLTPLTEEEFEKIKAQQEAQKRGFKSDMAHQPASQAPPVHENNPVVWPKVPNKVVEENKEPELPKQSFTWPKASYNDPNITTPSSNLNVTSKTQFDSPAERPSRGNHGIIIFQTIDTLVEAEKLLINEGCIITRVDAPIDLPSGSSVALRFHWEQYETVKSLLANAGVHTEGIRRLSS
jgi:hypothetical protein